MFFPREEEQKRKRKQKKVLEEEEEEKALLSFLAFCLFCSPFSLQMPPPLCSSGPLFHPMPEKKIKMLISVFIHTAVLLKRLAVLSWD